jgi:hypothetical protein
MAPNNDGQMSGGPASILGHGMAVVLGVIFMILGLAMGVSIVLLPLGLPLGIVGLFMLLWGLFGRAEDTRRRAPGGGEDREPQIEHR